MKYLLFLALTLLVSQSFAQSKRFFDNSDIQTDSANSYYYVLSMIDVDTKQYNSISYYTKTNTIYFNEGPLNENGTRLRTFYYPNGVEKASGSFKGSRPIGLVKAYYSNGKQQSELIFEEFKLMQKTDPILGIIDYWDSLGNPIIVAGKGYCNCNLNPFTNRVIIEEGNVAEGTKMGEWKGYDRVELSDFSETYDQGILVSGVSHHNKQNFKYDKIEKSSLPVDGLAAFYAGVAEKVKYPVRARRKGIEGTVYIEFVVSRDGNLSNFKVLRGIDAECDREALRVVSASSKWNPALVRGRPVKQVFALPVIFKLK
ncbi:MAG: TonB family protein [Cyclobacteriaceae bacterium]|nr:TonB family protein [Cyclobacteriaceae bacterium]